MFDRKYHKDRPTHDKLTELGFEKRATMGVVIYHHPIHNIEVNSMASIMRFDNFARVWFGQTECDTIGKINDCARDKELKDRIFEIKKNNGLQNDESDD